MRRLPRALQHLRFDFLHSLRGAPDTLRLFCRPVTFLALALLAAITWLLILHDSTLLAWINTHRNRYLEGIARWFSYWGDYPTGTLPIAAVLWSIGFFARKVNWRRAAIACLLAATITGTFTVITRCSLGRPRPCANITDGLYGMSVSYNYQAFPSGHSATSWATATALVITAPPVGIPIAVGAAGVVWSRLYLERHHTSDVFVGAWIGIIGGLIAGLASRHHRKYAKRKAAPVDASLPLPLLVQLPTPIDLTTSPSNPEPPAPAVVTN
ncbi:MAG: hypothetical protein B9S32_13940 [Verrucomicrobia bacterium Tous-C9LFEB]|nr:MAG: hypothetical protein B9S32_13940 [Verrucomicrobia bacterium Tous-C9LFEB]